ncbi:MULTISPECIES: hypothetical protein [Kribbella]|jgi:hypothetical protein|uniref:Uncharacterized protein n=1 Tax=Kribbella pratensis TaxID=2512112 RepID=A0ABY2F947_9ACTN|nr:MULTISPECIES: hypothetical protein [Kribbella]TDW87111.1 hypothetical protein EV137_5182 [Kribbella pratensis]TDW91564.1 hypothetical protein EV647_5145 [Kribbella sp. VKM Ac-2566]
MTETDFEGPDYDPAFDAEHDTDDDTEQEESEPDVPVEADPADVEEQRREVGDSDEDDYR